MRDNLKCNFSNFVKNKSGIVAFEMAILLPIILMLSLVGINIGMYLSSEASTVKAADSFANAFAASEPYDDSNDLQDIVDSWYLKQSNLSQVINNNINLMLNKPVGSFSARVIVTSLRRDSGQLPAINWQETYNFGDTGKFGGSVFANLNGAGCEGVCQIANSSQMAANEGFLAVEVYNLFEPPVNILSLPMIGESVIYSAAAYPARFGALKCLSPRVLPGCI